MNQDALRRILTDKNLAQLGDAILNFALSAALSRITGNPVGRRVRNSLLTSIIDSSPIKPVLPLRTSRRDRANAFEALAGYLWLHGEIQTDEILNAMLRGDDASLLESEREPCMMQAAFKLLADRVEATPPRLKTET